MGHFRVVVAESLTLESSSKIVGGSNIYRKPFLSLSNKPVTKLKLRQQFGDKLTAVWAQNVEPRTIIVFNCVVLVSRDAVDTKAVFSLGILREPPKQLR